MIQIIPSVHSASSKVITINGKYYAEVNSMHVEDFLIELGISLAAEVERLRERLIILEDQIKMYKGQ